MTAGEGAPLAVPKAKAVRARLRCARATLACNDMPERDTSGKFNAGRADCFVVMTATVDWHTANDFRRNLSDVHGSDLIAERRNFHQIHASLCLDGLDVDDVTRAEDQEDGQ